MPGQIALGLLQLVGNRELGRRNWEMVQRHLAAAKGSARGWLSDVESARGQPVLQISNSSSLPGLS